MKNIIAILLFLGFATTSCHKQPDTTPPPKPIIDTASTSAFTRVETYAGITVDSQAADGCGSLARTITENYTVNYCRDPAWINIAGTAHIINNPCMAAADSGYSSYSYACLIPNDGGTLYNFANNNTHIYQTIAFRADSIFVTIQHWRCNTNDICFFRGKKI